MRRLLLACLFGSLGCSSLTDLNVGYQRSLNAGRNAVGVNASSGAGSSDGGLGFQVRTKFGSEVKQVGAGLHGYLATGGKFLGLSQGFENAAYVRLGADVLQVGVAEGHGSVSLMSPFLDVGWIIPNPGVSLSLSTQYDLRLSSAKNDFWIGAFLGFGFASRL